MVKVKELISLLDQEDPEAIVVVKNKRGHTIDNGSFFVKKENILLNQKNMMVTCNDCNLGDESNKCPVRGRWSCPYCGSKNFRIMKRG